MTTMIIDKNAPTYADYLDIKNILKSYTTDQIQLIEDTLGDAARLATIEGIEDQIELFEQEVGTVFYVVLEEDGDDFVVEMKRRTLTAKEVDNT